MTIGLKDIFTDAQLAADLAVLNDAVEATTRQIADVSGKLEGCAPARRRRLYDKHVRLLAHRDELETEALELRDILEDGK
jgi:hypothetical protein